jgi:hypothetical protein
VHGPPSGTAREGSDDGTVFTGSGFLAGFAVEKLAADHLDASESAFRRSCAPS